MFCFTFLLCMYQHYDFITYALACFSTSPGEFKLQKDRNFLLMTMTAPESAPFPDKLSVDISGLNQGGLPWWLSGKEVTCQAGDLGSILGEFPWLRKSKPTPIVLNEKSHGRKSVTRYSLWGCRRVRCDKQQQHE